MDAKLKALLRHAQSSEMSPTERASQRISFAYGNLKIENGRIQKSMVVRLAQEIPGPRK